RRLRGQRARCRPGVAAVRGCRPSNIEPGRVDQTAGGRSQARMTAGSDAIVATAGGGLLALPILLPALGVLLSFLIGGRAAGCVTGGPPLAGTRPGRA